MFAPRRVKTDTELRLLERSTRLTSAIRRTVRMGEGRHVARPQQAYARA